MEAAELGGVGAEGSGDGAVLIDDVAVLVESTETDELNFEATTAATVGAECCTEPWDKEEVDDELWVADAAVVLLDACCCCWICEEESAAGAAALLLVELLIVISNPVSVTAL